VAVWRFCAAAGRAGKKIVVADGIPEPAMIFVLWVWVAPFLTFLGVHAWALTNRLAALFYSIFRSIRQERIECNMVSRLRL
jgi:type IV secretory pathway TrbD component